MTTITKNNVYTTTDGLTFKTHKEAKLQQDFLDRSARLQQTFDRLGFAPDPDGNVSASADVLAEYGAEILAALTIPSGRAPRKPKVVPETA